MNELKFQVSLDTKLGFTEKPTIEAYKKMYPYADTAYTCKKTGLIKNTPVQDIIVKRTQMSEITQDLLINYLTNGHSIITSLLIDYKLFKDKRSAKNSSSVSILGFDIDNAKKDKDENGIAFDTPESVYNFLSLIGLKPSFMYPTFSDTPERRKFRVIFLLEEHLSLNDHQDIYKKILKLFNDNSIHPDRATSDVCRLLYGTQADAFYINYEPTTLDQLKNAVKDVASDEEIRVAKVVREKQISKTFNSNDSEAINKFNWHNDIESSKQLFYNLLLNNNKNGKYNNKDYDEKRDAIWGLKDINNGDYTATRNDFISFNASGRPDFVIPNESLDLERFESIFYSDSKNDRSIGFGSLIKSLKDKGLKYVPEVRKDNVITPTTKDNEYFLPEGQYLTSIDIKFKKRKTILISDTGTGKTTFFASLKGKKIMVLPNVTQVIQYCSQTDATPFYEGEKTISNHIACTYNSLKKLCEQIKPKEYILSLDEIHTLNLADYRNKANNEVLNLINDFKQVIGFTGTPIINKVPQLSNFDVIKVHSKNSINYGIGRLDYKELDKTLISKIIENINKNIQTVIFINDKKKAEELKDLLRDNHIDNVIIANSDKKEQEDYKETIINGNFTADVIITTSILEQGISITEHKKDINIYIVGYQFKESVKQLSARFRKKESNINIYLLRNLDSKVEPYNLNDDDRDIYYNSKIRQANKLKHNILSDFEEIIDNEYTLRDLVDLCNNSNSFFKNGTPLIYINNEVKINHLYLCFLLSERESNALNSNLEEYFKYFIDQGWSNLDSLVNEEELTKEEKKTKNNNKKEKAIQTENKINNFLSDINDENDSFINNVEYDLLKNKNKEMKTSDDNILEDLRYKVSYIERYCDHTPEKSSIQQAITILYKIDFNDSDWDLFLKKLVVEKTKNQKRNKLILESFEIGKRYTPSEISEIIYSIDNKKINKKESDKQRQSRLDFTTQILKQYFDLGKRVKVNCKETGKRVDGYLIKESYTNKLDLKLNKVKIKDLIQIDTLEDFILNN